MPATNRIAAQFSRKLLRTIQAALTNKRNRIIFLVITIILLQALVQAGKKLPEPDRSDNPYNVHKSVHAGWYKALLIPKVAELPVCHLALYQKPVVRKEIFHDDLVLEFIIPLKGRF